MADHACPDCGAVHREKPTSLKKRIEMLEARMASLEARMPQWSWTQPTWYYDSTTGSGSVPPTVTQPAND